MASSSTFQFFGWTTCIVSVFESKIDVVYSTKMKILTYTSYKKRFELYTKIDGSFAVNNCQIEPPQKEKISLSEVVLIPYEAG